MRHTTAFLVLLGCLSGGAAAQAAATANTPNATSEYADASRPCTAPEPAPATSAPDRSAPQNQIEYRG